MPLLNKLIRMSWRWGIYGILTMAFIQNSMGQEIESKKIHLSDQQLEIHYLKAGNGKTKWVLIHGLGSYSKAYNKILSNLPDHVEAYALDLPGFGETKTSHDTISMESFAVIVNDFVMELGLTDVVLMGHSMGGQIAMTLAVTNPTWLKNLVLLAPAGIETFTEKDRAWFDAVVTESLYLNLTDEQIRQNFNINFNGMQLPEDAEFMYRDRIKIKEDQEYYEEYCKTTVGSIKAMLEGPVYLQIEKIKAPILVLFGQNDALIPNKILHPDLTVDHLMEGLTNDYPSIQHKVLERAGHFIIWDRTNKVLEEIETFTQAHK
ncbi:alpha/beta fold hydrolase [Flagellimonas okinawensis]|uniref:Alpha/beta hydrolase n=1 Tax=Flagellimonas okinawensis TaxID=3031324 RepID=A0ABT5XSP0_9FLAO|nr:alpha/beta hydrolase [[Muricauda] okinawensis]MDF0708845.1 alpha/beta hydrolase [[Muricauda] okinawensis]